MRIEVTQEDINEGCQSSCMSCPIALAIARAYGCAAEVGNVSVRVEGFGGFRLPQEAINFIDQFDNHGPAAVAPFSFEL
jgi:hypothetical protein